MLTLIEILISLSSPLVAIYLFYLNKKFVKNITNKNEIFIHKIYKEKLSAEKIEHVLSQFLDMYNSSKDTGISALIKAGTGSLDTEEDIQFVVTEIETRTGKHPLGKYGYSIKEVGLLKFFKNTDLLSFKNSTGIENIIEKLKTKI